MNPSRGCRAILMGAVLFCYDREGTETSLMFWAAQKIRVFLCVLFFRLMHESESPFYFHFGNFFSLLNSVEHALRFTSLQDLCPTFQSSFLSLDRALANNIDDLNFSPKRKRNMLPGALVYGVKAIPAEKSLQMKSDRHFPRRHCFPNRLQRHRQQPPPFCFPCLFC